MSFPASLTVVTITGTLLDGAGVPRAGKVVFRTPGYTMSGPDDTFVLPRVQVAFLDGAGHFAITLPSTTDPDWTPVGWTYTVTLDLGENGRTRFGAIVVPHDQGSTLSLASLAPVPSVDGQLYALYNDPRFSGIGGGGGGAVSSVFGRSGIVVAQTGDYTKAQVGLGNVDNTSDANKPVSTLQATADATVASDAATALSGGLAGKSNTGHGHAESDIASLVSDLAAKAPFASPTFTGTVNGITAAMVGLGNVTNTSDANKPVSTAQQTALNGKFDLSTATTKGDLFVATGAGTIVRLGVGSDTFVLTADAAQASGVKWAAGGGAGAYSLPDGIDPPANDPHAIPNGPVSANLTTVLNRMYFSPMPIGPNTRTLIEISIEVGAAGAAGAVYRLVLFSATTGRRPNVSLVDFGTVVGDSTGAKKIVSLSQACAANTLYWLGVAEQVASGGALKGIQSYNPYVTLHGSDLAGSNGFGAYAMASVSGAVTNGTAFVYFDVDTAPRFGVKFS